LRYDGSVPERIEPIGYVQTTFTFEDEGEDSAELSNLRQLHESLAPYLDVPRLRQLVAERSDIYAALRSDRPPAEVLALMDTLAALLRPSPTEQIRNPRDAVALLMVTMGHLDQEELRTILLDTKNRVQDIVTVYRGSVNTTLIRAGEVYKAALRRNSAAIIVSHNHPSTDVTPSPEDVLVTRQIVEAGAILDIDCLDHLIIGRGAWCSLRERGLGFTQ
jgi:DNA repair protein RadC